jgi:hypothetical protein
MSSKKFLADINMDGNKIGNVANPTQSGDVATFNWVNDIIDDQELVDTSIESRVVSIISNDTVEIDSITEIVQVIQLNEMALDSAITSLETIINNMNEISIGPTGPNGANGSDGINGSDGADKPIFERKSDFQSTFQYSGNAPLGTLTSQNWNINRIDFGTPGSPITLSAIGPWDDRTILIYT